MEAKKESCMPAVADLHHFHVEEDPNPNPHLSENPDPDLHSREKLDSDLH
jgi:hypothetical protein